MSVCAQIYRYGQTQAVYAYRLIAFGTAEHVAYRVQLEKQSLALYAAASFLI